MTQAPKPPTPDMSALSEGMKAFVAHLIELRDRLLRAVIAVVVLMFMILPWASELYSIFATPVINSLPDGQSMIATGAISPFFIPLKLAALAAVFIAMPYILYQLWAFIAPGLYQHEKRFAMPLIVSSSLLFYVGAGFAYFIVIPAVFHFMAMFTPQGVEFMPDIGNYLDFAIGLFFTFGLAFEVPVAVVLLSITGVVTPDQLAEKRRYAILVAFIIGAIFTPPDILSQFMLAIPVWMLYELGILVARIIIKNKAKDEDNEDNAQTPQLAAPLAAALPIAASGALSADESSASPPDDALSIEHQATPADEPPDMEAEFARAEEDERRLNAGETLTPSDPSPTTEPADEPPDMDAEFARAEEDERRLNAGETLTPSDPSPASEHAAVTPTSEDDAPLIQRDDRNTALQEPSHAHESGDDAAANKPNP